MHTVLDPPEATHWIFDGNKNDLDTKLATSSTFHY